MTDYLIYKNAKAIAHAVKPLVGLNTVSPRPYNRFDPEGTEWWLLPTREWPSYSSGKFIFSPTVATTGAMLCGVHFEKGFGPEARTLFKSKKDKKLLNKDWVWFQFLQGLDTGETMEIMSLISQQCKKSVKLIISSSPLQVSPQDYDPYEPKRRPKEDTVTYDYEDGLLNLLSSKEDLHHLPSPETSMTPRDIGNWLQSLEKPDWFWLNVYIGVDFLLSGSPADPQVWKAKDLWGKLLCHWKPYLR